MAGAKVFVVRNQHEQYLNKQNEWVDGTEKHSLFRSPHKDVAINQLFEATMKDIGMRGEVLSCATDAKGDPLINSLEPQIEQAPSEDLTAQDQ